MELKRVGVDLAKYSRFRLPGYGPNPFSFATVYHSQIQCESVRSLELARSVDFSDLELAKVMPNLGSFSVKDLGFL